MNFYQDIYRYWEWDDILDTLNGIGRDEVEVALSMKGRGRLEDFLALISPAALPYLEEMAQTSQELTRKRFGKTVQLYLPLYLSNHCQNICSYCGFSYHNKIDRIVLSPQEVLEEITAIKKMGIEHILLVTGEDSRYADSRYLAEIISLCKKHFAHVSLEVQPLREEEYHLLRKKGLDAVLLYQETYHEEHYKIYHPRGKKSNFLNRLESMDQLGRSGIHKMGLGVLLGLEDWRVDSFFCALHLHYLKKKYWQTRYSVSFPRLRPATGVNKNDYRKVGEKELAQLIFAYRIWDEDLELSLSTREREHFRNHIIPLGITIISAGSKTNPGGYACYPDDSLEQFSISDSRSPDQMIKYLQNQGFEVVMKDWAKEFTNLID